VPRFTDRDAEFICPYRDGCPYLEGLSTQWVWEHYQATAGSECQNRAGSEYQLNCYVFRVVLAKIF
jgi:hypothetical protein